VTTVTRASSASTWYEPLLRLSFAMLEYFFEFFFKRSRRNSECAKSRPVHRGRGVDLHKLDLIAGEGWLRQGFSETRNGTPESKGHPHQHRPQSCATGNGPQQLLV
jgi:hypothetical protein